MTGTHFCARAQTGCVYMPITWKRQRSASNRVQGSGGEGEATARFEVKGARHAEGQQTGRDLCGGIGKTSERTHSVRKKTDRPRNSAVGCPNRTGS